MKFTSFVGCWAGRLHRLRLDEMRRKLPQPTSSFALLQKKEESSTGPRWVSCRVNQWVTSHPQTSGSPALFNSELKQFLTHVQIGKVSFFPLQCLVYGSSWLGSTRLTQADSVMSLSPLTQSKTPLLVLSPPAYVNTHALENKPSINPYTLWQFCPDGVGGGGGGGGGGRRRREAERGGKDRKKKNEGGNCNVGRNPPSPFPGEEVD